MKILAGIAINAFAFYLITYILPGFQITDGLTGLIVTAVVWGVLAAFLKPIIKILTLPINIITLGLFSFVINAGLLLLTAQIVSGFTIASFGTALIAAILLTVISSLLNGLVVD